MLLVVGGLQGVASYVLLKFGPFGLMYTLKHAVDGKGGPRDPLKTCQNYIWTPYFSHFTLFYRESQNGAFFQKRHRNENSESNEILLRCTRIRINL